MTEKEELIYQEEYFNRKFFWTTTFRNNYYRNINGLCSNKFWGTESEYKKLLSPYLQSDTYGKVADYQKYTEYEWLELHNISPEDAKKIEENKELINNPKEEKLTRDNTNKRYWKYL